MNREFSRSYNLRRHITRFHQPEIPSDSDKMETVKSWLDASATQALQQTGGGAGGGSEGGDIEDTISETSTEKTDSEGQISTTGSSCDVNDGSTYDDEASDSLDDENWVFNRLLLETENELDEDDPVSYRCIQKLFRKKYADYLVWINDLRKNSIHKKVMATAKELEGGPEFYDRNEALRAAVRQRQYLLNRLVPRPESVGDEDDAESEDQSQEDL